MYETNKNMKKRIILFGLTALLLAACSTDNADDYNDITASPNQGDISYEGIWSIDDEPVEQYVNGMQTDIGHDRLQWSLNGALGVACSLTPHVSLFAEPGVRHYFDNGSPLQNYFKDKPTSLSLRVGVQLNVGTK